MSGTVGRVNADAEDMARSDEELDTAVRYVAFADIFGFKQLVKRNAHAYLLNVARGAIRPAAELAATAGLLLPGTQRADPDTPMLNMRMISDSIVLWTDKGRAPEFEFMILGVGNLLAMCLGFGIPARAAVACGEFTCMRRRYASSRLGDSEVLLGEALVDAYEAEDEQQWSGGLVHQSAIDAYSAAAAIVPEAAGIAGLIEQHLVVPYDVPLKDCVRPSLAIGWTRFLPPLSRALLEDAFGDHGKQFEGEARWKLANTIEFAVHVGALRTEE